MIESRPEPRGTIRRDIARDRALVKRACSPFGELDGHLASLKTVISRDDVTKRQVKETKRERERRLARERKIRTGMI